MTTLADILTPEGTLPPPEQFDPKAHALLVPDATYAAAMAALGSKRPSRLAASIAAGDAKWRDSSWHRR